MRFFIFNLFLIIHFKIKKNERKNHVKRQGKKTVKKASERAVNSNVSTSSSNAGRPESGVIKGILPEHRRDVIKDILSWKEKKYFLEDNPTSLKALAKWAYDHFDFKSVYNKKLALSTIEQLFGEVSREMNLEITTQKKAKRADKRKKILHNN